MRHTSSAEDMHCPTVPLAAAIDGYVVNGIVKKIVNGAEVRYRN